MRTKCGHVYLSLVLLSLLILPGCWLWESNSPAQLFVPDTNNNRVLLYDSPSQNGQAATVVLGQSLFTTAAFTPVTAQSLFIPSGLAMDNAGNLYVSDSNNCRILQISPPFTTDKAANFAIGQPNLTTNTCPGVGGFYYPVGLAFDRNGNLWVADSVVSSQVLKFDANSLTAANAASATPSQVIGTTNCTNTATAGGLCYPSGVAFDSSGNLWVSDTNNHRVLMFPSGNLVTGATPTFVLGQTVTSGSGVRYCNQSAGGSPASASTLCRPSGIAFDSSGNLWVADSSNNRVLKYAKADLDSAISSQTNDVAATLEVGQPAGSGAFTSNTPNNGGIGPSTLAYPLSVGFDNSGRLIVGDGNNNRILFFPSPFSNGMGATLVLGQPNFTTGTPNTPAPNWPPIPGTPSATNLSLEPIG